MQGAARYWLAGSLTLLVGLLLFFPARIAYQWFAPDTIKVAGFDGSVWRGSATEAWVGGLYLRDLRWSVRPARLLTGKLGYALAARPSSGFVDGDVAIGLGGRLTLSAVSGAVPLELLRPIVNSPGLKGSLSLQIDEAELDDGMPISATGTFEVANIVEPRLHPGSLGGYRGQLASDAGVLLITYEDTDGVFDIEGRISVREGGEFVHSARLRAKNTTPPRFQQFIDTLPFAEDGSGWREYVLGEGKL